MVRNESKFGLEGHWFGPYKVEEANNGTYRISSIDNPTRVFPIHGDRLKKITEIPEESWYTMTMRNQRRSQLERDHAIQQGESMEQMRAMGEDERGVDSML